jgi:hypothetical protein
MSDPDSFSRLWRVLAVEARSDNHTEETIQRFALGELTSDDARTAIADIQSAVSSEDAPSDLSPFTSVALLAIVLGSVELNSAKALRACACAWLLHYRLGQPFVQYVLGTFVLTVDDLPDAAVRASISFVESLIPHVDADGYRALFMLSELFLVVRSAVRLSRRIPAVVEQDMMHIARSVETPTTWLLGIGGSSRIEYPWDSIMLRLQGESGSLVELGAFLEKCGSPIEPDQAS